MNGYTQNVNKIYFVVSPLFIRRDKRSAHV